jgi:hypothetical protein
LNIYIEFEADGKTMICKADSYIFEIGENKSLRCNPQYIEEAENHCAESSLP